LTNIFITSCLRALERRSGLERVGERDEGTASRKPFSTGFNRCLLETDERLGHVARHAPGEKAGANVADFERTRLISDTAACKASLVVSQKILVA
jgi:hypothetical protein